MKNVIFFTLFLFCCLQANGQDYLQEANNCFEKGDYECAKRNYTIFQTFDGSDMSAQIQKADECIKALIGADNYFNDEEWEKARDRYQIVLEKNPKDPNAKKQFDLCVEYLKPVKDRLQYKRGTYRKMNFTTESSISNKEYDDKRTNHQKKEKRFHFGLKMGLNVSNVEETDYVYNYDYSGYWYTWKYDYKAGMHVGVFGEFRFNKFAVQPELLYSRQGGRGALREYFAIPIMAKYYVIEGLCIEIGPQTGFLDFSFSESISCAVNLGTSYQIPRIPLGFSLRYSHDFYKDHPWLPKNRVFQIGAFYKF